MITDRLMSDSQREVTLRYLDHFQDVPSLWPVACFARACLLLARRASSDIAQACEEAEAMARAILAHPDRDGLELDPLLLVEHSAMLSRAGCVTPQLHQIVQMIADQMDGLPDDVRAAGRTGHLARLLAKAGLGSKPGVGTCPPAPDEEKLLLRSSDEIRELIENLSATPRVLTDTAAEILSLLALSELRDYRLDCGIAILRYLIQSNQADAYLVEAVRFVALQRTALGTYGFSNPLIDDGLDPAERDQRLHLPNTLNAVWLFKLVEDGRLRGMGSTHHGSVAA